MDLKNSPPILGGVAEGRGGNWKYLFPNQPPLVPSLTKEGSKNKFFPNTCIFLHAFFGLKREYIENEKK